MKKKPVKTIKKQLSYLFAGFDHLLWPSKCVNCNNWIPQKNEILCKDCWNELLTSVDPEYCPQCGNNVSRYALLPTGCPACANQDHQFDAIARAGTYKDTLREMILAFKTADKTELAPFLAKMLKPAVQSAKLHKDIDFYVPVPLHWTRRLKRGYNQSLLIAKHIAPEKTFVSTDLVRIKKTKFQFELSPAKRAANVAGAFAVRKDHNFKNKTICLVDDIKTSGATLDECAKTLKSAGASRVFAAVIAVAGQDLK